FALTTSDVQDGDYVYQTDTAILYEVTDDTALDEAGGYTALATLGWSAITDKPTSASGLGITTGAVIDGWGGKTVPTGPVVGTADAQTLTNKTLTAPVISSPTGLVKADVSLGNVDNTSDADKPVSTAQQTALDLKLNRT